ncbi:UDP-N-acetylmuramoyl-L-alanyl-D-glutamate--2,6-diaminopimelate ligase [Candidatus Nitrotoga arctica]|uniref:UDP-N-acetylmuramoyl-L-alanyl-D-glutamate--2,6-diaminopimelate ligase n=1 Tax=Candidatus Nitrotoga arctica TaxID=453162 RepID=A0ABM8Z319_9PROT|nr:UDP-N-acetylmuramoyl-L-alanyl-D-glutamate--2,6-diaminopimelate ligase [Candidatus Nitrotoga arctica]CAG9934307.1 UDP-N-acetylmuramoyl-L-alanyl-D-glutamate--2, 6-diaminopimelate ligase [Candidatus Nitrotoga arctica]
MSFHSDLISSLGVKVTRLATESRAVAPGDTFIAYPGSKADGRQFIKQAIANGANAVIWEALGFSWNGAWQLPNLAVADLRHHAGEIADHVYGSPSQKMWVVGITGTNGKTSCCHWIAQSFCALGKKTALIGTLGNGFHSALQPTLNTTPDAIRLHELLADYLAQGAQAVAMEVSSHALEQGRVNGVQFDVALLTNLSRDHLDYHGDMHSYAAAKRRLFDWQQLKYVVLNLDDAFGAEIAEQLQDKGVEVVGYGLNDAALALAERLGLRMVYGGALRMDRQGFSLQIHSSWGGGELHNTLIGRFNVANLLGVMAVLLVSGVTLSNALHELSHISAVPGRMQTFSEGGRPTVVVDYAHTPDALEKVLQALRELVGHAIVGADNGKLICVFGCGGDRDRGKRPMMGAIAAKLADISIITSDNPRSEAPLDIIATIVSGITSGRRETNGTYQIIEDRASAIAQAVLSAHATDIVLIAGKGHESYQEVRGIKYPFSDAEVAQRALLAWRNEARA